MTTSQAWLVGQHYQKKTRLAGISTTYRDSLYILSSRAGGEKELARRNWVFRVVGQHHLVQVWTVHRNADQLSGYWCGSHACFPHDRHLPDVLLLMLEMDMHQQQVR